jgi:N-acetylglucosaminyl-diphospho-decaprenol L-rhamnosyltransferase
MTGHAPLAVVVVSFNTCEYLRACLTSVVNQRAASVVVADNGSTDGTIEMIEREFPRVVIDLDRRNPGYAAGANRGIRRCDGADVLLLNSDTRLTAGALDALATYLGQHPEAGVVGPRLVNGDGSLQRSTFPFPSPMRPSLQQPVLRWLLHTVPYLGERNLATWSHGRSRAVPYIMGAAMAIRRQAFEAVGGFDESYFMYAEEADLCWRMRAAGWETHFAPVTEVVHAGRGSTKQWRAEMLERAALSQLQFCRSHYTGPRRTLAVLVSQAVMGLRIIRDTARLLLVTDAAVRREIAENLRVWQRVFLGRSMAA